MSWISRLLEKLGISPAIPERKKPRRRIEYFSGDASSFTSNSFPENSGDSGPHFGGGEFSGGGGGGSWSDSSSDSSGDSGGDSGGGDGGGGD